MRITYLASRPIPSRNANSVQIVQMCEAFARNGHDVSLCALHGDAPAESIFERFNVARLFHFDALPARPRPLRNLVFYIQAIRRLSRRRDTDLFYSRDVKSLVAASWFGKPLVYEAHLIPPRNSLRWRIRSWLFARGNFSHLVCITSSLANEHRRQFPALAAKPVIVAPCSAAEIGEAGDLDSWPGREGAVQVGFVGRPFPGKGIEAIVTAARDLPHIDFHVVGATAADLDWMAAELPSNLHLHGYQPHSKLPSYYRRFDMAVAPYGAKVMNASGFESASNTSPLKLGEYLAAGLPTIVSDLPGVQDMVEGGDCVLMVPAGDEQAFVQAVRRLAEDAGLRRRLGAAARLWYLERHTTLARGQAVLAPLQQDLRSEMPAPAPPAAKKAAA